MHLLLNDEDLPWACLVEQALNERWVLMRAEDRRIIHDFATLDTLMKFRRGACRGAVAKWRTTGIGIYLRDGRYVYLAERTGQILFTTVQSVVYELPVDLRVIIKRRVFIEQKIELLMPHRERIAWNDARRGLRHIANAPAMVGEKAERWCLTDAEIREIIHAVYSTSTQGALL